MTDPNTRAPRSTAHKQAQARLKLQQQAQQQSTPYWAQPLPLLPEVDFQAAINDDLKLLALIAAVRQIGAQRGQSFQSQMDVWNHGRGRG